MTIQKWLKEHPRYTKTWTRGKFLLGDKARFSSRKVQKLPSHYRIGQIGTIVARTKKARGAWGNNYVVQWSDGKMLIVVSWGLEKASYRPKTCETCGGNGDIFNAGWPKNKLPSYDPRATKGFYTPCPDCQSQESETESKQLHEKIQSQMKDFGFIKD